jgi:hypothetical protein
MKQLIIMSLEPIESRYTNQWFTHLPKIFKEKLGHDFEVIQLNGETKSGKVTEGAFLDFESTNCWKSEQTIKFFQMMKQGRINNDAVILFTDAWNPCVHQIKYTKELCNRNWKLIGMWHAGSYDPSDFLGRIKDLGWAKTTEAALHKAYDINWFATEFHKELFHDKLCMNDTDKSIVAGFPMEYIKDIKFPKAKKENLVVFPARMAPEKQPEIIKEIAKLLPEYKFVFCCEENMTKIQYHETLAKAKVMISVSLQETLGICPIESMSSKCIPLVPNRLSYREMYNSTYFTYPSSWSIKETLNIKLLANTIKTYIDNYETYIPELEKVYEYQMENFCSCSKIINIIKSY